MKFVEFYGYCCYWALRGVYGTLHSAMSGAMNCQCQMCIFVSVDGSSKLKVFRSILVIIQPEITAVLLALCTFRPKSTKKTSKEKRERKGFCRNSWDHTLVKWVILWSSWKCSLLIIKITISSLEIGLKKAYFPLIRLPSCYRTVCYWIQKFWFYQTSW